MALRLIVLAGDGVGPEVTAEALRVLAWFRGRRGLEPEVRDGVDLVVVSESTGGLYFGEPRGIGRLADGTERGVNTQVYTTGEIERIARAAFDLALVRRGRACSVDKSNVMESGAPWRRTVARAERAPVGALRAGARIRPRHRRAGRRPSARRDPLGGAKAGEATVSTAGMGDAVAAALDRPADYG